MVASPELHVLQVTAMLYEALQEVVTVLLVSNVALFISMLSVGHGLERQLCSFTCLGFLSKGMFVLLQI